MIIKENDNHIIPIKN